MSAFSSNHQVFVRSPYLSWPDVCLQEPCVSRHRHSLHALRGVPPDPNWHRHRHSAHPSRNRDVDIRSLPNGPVFPRFQDPTVVKDSRSCASAYRWKKGEQRSRSSQPPRLFVRLCQGRKGIEHNLQRHLRNDVGCFGSCSGPPGVTKNVPSILNGIAPWQAANDKQYWFELETNYVCSPPSYDYSEGSGNKQPEHV